MVLHFQAPGNQMVACGKTDMDIWMIKVQFLKITVSSCHKQSAKPPGSNSSPRLRFVLEPRRREPSITLEEVV